MKDKILLIDTLAQVFRSYYALEKTGLQTTQGVKTFAIYGFFKSLLKAIRQIQPTHCIIISDCQEITFRKEMYQDYKIHRKETPDDLKEQIASLSHFLKESGLPYVEKAGLEADDIIATYAQYFSEKGDQVYILSSDKDLCQLVNAHTFMLSNPKTLHEPFRILGESEIIEKFAVKPYQILDYLALTGDASDNIPGVKGIGPKGASELIKMYDNLETIYQNLEQLPLKMKEKLIEFQDNARLSYQLVTLRKDPQIIAETSFYDFKASALEKLEQYFIQLEFKNLEDIHVFRSLIPKKEISENLFEPEELKKIDSFSSKHSLKVNEKRVDYQSLITLDELKKLAAEIQGQKWVVLDTETTSLDVAGADLLGISFCLKEKKAYYVPFDRPLITNYSLKDFQDIFQPLFLDGQIKKIGHNLKYDYGILSRYFGDIQGLYFDTMIAAYLLNTDLKRYNMDYLAIHYLGYQTQSYKELVPHKNMTLSDVDLEKVTFYACEDADITMRLYQIFTEEIKNKELESIFFDLEMPLIPVLSMMEQKGICINSLYFQQFKKELEESIRGIEKKIYEEASQTFNLNSPKQVGEILYQKMKLIPRGKKAGKQFSTNEETLLTLEQVPIVKWLLEYRKYFKLYSTYVVPFSLYKNQNKDGNIRITTHFHQTGTATGRLSSSHPNLQNIPTKDPIGRRIREGFVAKKGYILTGLDYSQIELRLLAHYSQDSFLVEAFLKKQDIHKMTAAKIFDKKEEDILDSERNVAKTINFGIIYGMGAQKLSKEIGISVKEAKNFIDTYFTIFQGVSNFIDHVKKQVHETQVITTLCGRKRFFPEINTAPSYIVATHERMAVNTIIQGSSADLMKLGMIKIYQHYAQNQDVHLLLQIHDELIFEILKKNANIISNEIKIFMEQIYSLKVPLEVSLNISENWSGLK